MRIRLDVDIIGPVRIETSRVLPTDWKILKKVRLSALRDTPSAFGSKLAAEIGRTDEDWQLRASQASAGEEVATFLAALDQRTIGIVTGYRPAETPHEVELVSMWTSPDARRSGAGRLMVQAVIDWANEIQVRSVGLWVMRANPAAERLYESMGFTEEVDYRALPSDPCAEELRVSLALGETDPSTESRLTAP